MKKVLSLVLAFAMILGSFGFVFASDFPDVKDSEYYGEPVNVLSGLGVIGGFPDGTFKPGKEVTRAEMATMVVNALGMTVTGKSDTKFSDVPSSHWASGFIAYATSVGFVAGYPDGTFKPDKEVTYDQALTMIVAALGYQSEALPGNWPGNFVNKAQGLGILDTCKTTGSANAPRQDIACFLYDSLDQAIGYTDKDGAWHANIGPKNALGGFDDDTMYVRLGAQDYANADANGYFVVKGTETAEIDLQKYMGAYVSAKATKADDTDIVAIAEVKSEFLEGSFNKAKDKFTTTDGTAYKVDPADAQVEYGKKGGELAFVSFTNGDPDKTAVAYNSPAAGQKVILAVALSGSRITRVYSLQVWDSTGTKGDTFMAEDDIQEGIADDQKVGAFDLPMNDDDEIETSAFTIVGDKTDLKDLAEDDVLTVYLHQTGDYAGKIAKIEVSTKTIEGVVTKIADSDKDGTDDEFTIGGEVYGLNADSSKTPADMTTLMNGETEAKFYLDYAGDIYSFEELSDAATYFAILLDFSSVPGKYTGDVTNYAKLFLEDGTVKEFEPDTKVYAKVSAITKGSLVEYTVDDDELTDIKAETAVKGAKVEFDSNGVLKGAKEALTSKTVVFNYTGTSFTDGKETNKDNWSVMEVSALMGGKADDFGYFVDGGKYTAARVLNAAGQTAAYAVFVSKDGTAKDGDLYTALYEGKVQTLTVKGVTPSAYSTAGPIDASTLTLNSKGVVTGFATTKTAVAPTKAAVTNTSGKAVAVSISGTMFTDAVGANFTMDENALVYIYDESDDAWTAGSLNSMTGKAYSYIYLYKLGTGDYDLVILIKE